MDKSHSYIGPELTWHLRPLLICGYHWTGRSDDFPITADSDVIAVAIGHDLRVGYARSLIYAGMGWIGDNYRLTLASGRWERQEHESLRPVLGWDLRLLLFEGIDALVGYRFIWREQVSFTGTPEGDYPYEVEGLGTEHAVTFGVSLRLYGNLRQDRRP